MSRTNHDDHFNDPLRDPLLANVPVVDGFKVLGKVRLTRCLGGGGMGAVYRGIHRSLKIDVAVKCMLLQAGADAEDRERFQREAQLAAAITSPHLVRVYDVDEQDGLPYIVMEHVDGCSLRALVKREGPVPQEKAAELIFQAASGMAAAHHAGSGVVHRDLKPDNVMVTDDGAVKVVDLGLARSLGSGERLTQTNQFMGTVSYMPPEQFERGMNQVGKPADVYALGLTLYYLLAGQDLYPQGRGEEFPVMYHRICVAAPPSFDRALPKVDRRLRAVLAKATHRDPAARFKDAGALAAALRDLELVQACSRGRLVGGVAATEPQSDLKTSPEPRGGGSRRQWTAVVILALIAFVAYMQRHRFLSEGNGAASRPSQPQIVVERRGLSGGWEAAPMGEFAVARAADLRVRAVDASGPTRVSARLDEGPTIETVLGSRDQSTSPPAETMSGRRVWDLSVKSEAGGEVKRAIAFVLDEGKPSATFETSTTGGWVPAKEDGSLVIDDPAALRLKAADELTAVAVFAAVDAAPALDGSPATAPGGLLVLPAGLNGGDHIWQVVVRDAAGNRVERNLPFRLNLDRDGPTIVFEQLGADGAWKSVPKGTDVTLASPADLRVRSTDPSAPTKIAAVFDGTPGDALQRVEPGGILSLKSALGTRTEGRWFVSATDGVGNKSRAEIGFRFVTPPPPDSQQVISVRAWATILRQDPDPEMVKGEDVRVKIVATGYPWLVRHEASKIEFVLIPPGEYMRGASPENADASSDEKPAHKIVIDKPFYLARTEVTNRQYRTQIARHDSGKFDDDDLNMDIKPAVEVSWTAADDFCRKLGPGFGLPEEWEWEYAARAAISAAKPTTRYPWGNEWDSKLANGSSKSDGFAVTAPVGSFPADGFGLRDMIGNVWEWCATVYESDEYQRAKDGRPSPPSSTSAGPRVLRGGSWDNGPQYCRSSYRRRIDPSDTLAYVGFRPSRTLP